MLLDLRVDGYLCNSQTPCRELLRNCSEIYSYIQSIKTEHTQVCFLMLPIKTLCMVKVMFIAVLTCLICDNQVVRL